jgi:hypothetical protein
LEEVIMTTNKTTEVARVRSLITGLGKHFSTATNLTVGGASYAPSALTQLLQSFVDLSDGAAAAKVSYKDALKNQKAQAAALRAVIRAFRAFVFATFGNTPSALADFGLVPRKGPVPKTVEQKASAVVKNLATRAARHTVGSKAKKKIKGTLPAAPSPAPHPTATPANGAVASGSNEPSTSGSNAVTPQAPSAGTPHAQ